MVIDRGILTEAPATLALITQSFPEARLAPLDDPFAFAQVQAFNSYLEPDPKAYVDSKRLIRLTPGIAPSDRKSALRATKMNYRVGGGCGTKAPAMGPANPSASSFRSTPAGLPGWRAACA